MTTLIHGKRLPIEGDPKHVTLEWYDRVARIWIVTVHDEQDFQVGDAYYCANKFGLTDARRSVIIATREARIAV